MSQRSDELSWCRLMNHQVVPFPLNPMSGGSGLLHGLVTHQLRRRGVPRERMCAVPQPYPKEFRADVVRVARAREPGQTIKQVATDFGISESCLNSWLLQADREEGVTPAT